MPHLTAHREGTPGRNLEARPTEETTEKRPAHWSACFASLSRTLVLRRGTTHRKLGPFISIIHQEKIPDLLTSLFDRGSFLADTPTSQIPVACELTDNSPARP